MAYPDLFSPSDVQQLIQRIEMLTPSTQGLWGKMNVAQMVKHCTISFEQALEKNNQRPPAMMRWMLQLFFRKSMVNEVPYKQNLPTAPAFKIVDQPAFLTEQQKLKELILEFSARGKQHFEGKSQLTLGKLSALEWNNLMYKHIDHHLRQFGV